MAFRKAARPFPRWALVRVRVWTYTPHKVILKVFVKENYYSTWLQSPSHLHFISLLSQAHTISLLSQAHTISLLSQAHTISLLSQYH